MPMRISRYRKNEICHCGRTFVKTTPNQIHCPDCSYWPKGQGNIIKFIIFAEPRLKQAADESGNPKVWRRGDPVEMLPEGMKKRIEMAQQFGV